MSAVASPDDDIRYCERPDCRKAFARPNGIGRPQFAKFRFCSRRCAGMAIGQARGRKGGQAKAAKIHERKAERAQSLASPGEWRIYFPLAPTRRAGSLSEARARAGIGSPGYVEIANLETGQHLARFCGEWREIRPAGSPLMLLMSRSRADGAEENADV